MLKISNCHGFYSALPFSVVDNQVVRKQRQGYTKHSREYPKNPQTIADHLYKIRVDLKLTKSAAAIRLSVSPSTYAAWEDGVYQPDIRHMKAVIRLIGYYPFPNPKTFGEKIKKYRQVKGLTQEEFGALIDFDGATVSNWESGVYTASTLDKDWNFTYVNREFERIYKGKREEFIGMNYWQYFPKAKHQKFHSHYHRAIREKKVVSFEEFATSLDKWVSVKVYPTPDGITVFFTDITEQKQLLEKTLEAERQLLIQNKQLREIAWIQSHKVRAPLARILGLIPLLNYDTPEDTDNKTVLHGIKLASEQLDAVIREINDKTLERKNEQLSSGK